jgi:DNA-binding transcriptional MerR regulator
MENLPTTQSPLPQDEYQPCYSIEQVATRTGLTKRTLRYYEEMGLLLPTGRTEGNYRRYSEADVKRIERIKELRDLLGFSLTDIRTLMSAEDERIQIKEAYRQETEAQAKMAQLDRADELIHQQLNLIEQKLSGLEQMRATLQAKLEAHERTREKLRAQEVEFEH